MSGVIDERGVQWERTTCCGAYVPIFELAEDDTCPPGRGCVPAEPDRYSRKAAFAAHWERVELARGTNRDGLVRIAQPSRKSAPAAKAPKGAKTPKRAAVTIRVIRAY